MTEIRALSGADLSTIYAVYGNPALPESVGLVLEVIGDIDLDGVPDVASKEYWGIPSGFHQNDLVMRSGATGQAIYTITGVSQETTAFVTLGDVNGDGASEYAVGDWGANFGAGEVSLHDGATGAVFQTIASLGFRFGVELRPLGDINGDGYDDFSVGSGYTATQPLGAGNAFLFESGIAGAPYQLAQQYFQLLQGVRVFGVPDSIRLATRS